MRRHALHRLRQHSRRLAAATVAVFALNWLGLALMPCAMAFALPAPVVGDAASAATPQVGGQAVPAGCHGHTAVTALGAGSAPVAAGPSTDAEPCPWCAEAGAGGDHDANCGGLLKPAVDPRDAKNPVPPLLVALSAAVLGVVPAAAAVAAYAPADEALPAAVPAVDRYCRRLE